MKENKWKRLLLIGMAVLLVSCEAIEKAAQEAKAEEASKKAHLDSLTTASGIKWERHQSLMKTSRKYRDSVNKAIAVAEKALLDEDRTNNPEKHLTFSMNWHKGGFGTVALVDVKIKNQSLKDCVNPFVTVTFYANGKALSEKTEQVFETFPAGKTRKSKEINYGFINGQVNGADGKIISATYE